MEHKLQIMFHVGMGNSPPIPSFLSHEGKEFLSHCFEIDPQQRWTASQLQDHQFVKVRRINFSLKYTESPFCILLLFLFDFFTLTMKCEKICN